MQAELVDLDSCKLDAKGELKLGLEDCYKALARLGHERAKLVMGGLKRWRAATEQRNASILAHGVKSIGAGGFEEMKGIATDFLGFDLSKEANPIPPFDPQWLA